MSYNRQFILVLIFILGSFLVNLMFNNGEIEWVYIILTISALLLLVPIYTMAVHVFQDKIGLKSLLLTLTVYFFLVGCLAATFINDRNEFKRKQEQFAEQIKELENRDPRLPPGM